MKRSLCVFIFLTIFKEALLDRLAGVGCDVDPEGYVVPDPDYCNRYLECKPSGVGSIELCPLGQSLDLQTGLCLEKVRVDCSSRPQTFERAVSDSSRLSAPVHLNPIPLPPSTVSSGKSNSDAVITGRNRFGIPITLPSQGPPSEQESSFPGDNKFGLSQTNNLRASEPETAPRLSIFGSRNIPSDSSEPEKAEILLSPVSSGNPKLSASSIINSASKLQTIGTPSAARPKLSLFGSRRVPSGISSDQVVKKPDEVSSQFRTGSAVQLETLQKVSKPNEALSIRSQSSSSFRPLNTIAKVLLPSQANKVDSTLPSRSSSVLLPSTRLSSSNSQSVGSLALQEPKVLNIGSASSFSSSNFESFNTGQGSLSCDGKGSQYVVADPAYCDRYLSCPEGVFEVCQRGLVLDSKSGFCQRRSVTDCTGREKLFREVGPSDAEKSLSGDLNIGSIRGDPKIGTETLSVDSRLGSQRINSDVTSSGNDLGSQRIKSEVSDAFPRIQKVVPQSELRPSLSRRPLGEKNGFGVLPRVVKPEQSSIADGNPANQQPRSSISGLVCESTETGYNVADPENCDRYVECNASGVKRFKQCPTGQVFSADSGLCDHPRNVDCAGRRRSSAPSLSDDCPSLFGKFKVESDSTCREFVECSNGVSKKLACGVGQVFDETDGCVHPALSKRGGCSTQDTNGFQCPIISSLSRFGDHERYSHPTDCKLYYLCSRDGQRRLLGCEKPLVFNPETGFCDDQKNVAGCSNYYVDNVNLEDERAIIAQEIREQLIKEFGLTRL